jgi:hypothetical protein
MSLGVVVNHHGFEDAERPSFGQGKELEAIGVHEGIHEMYVNDVRMLLDQAA